MTFVADLPTRCRGWRTNECSMRRPCVPEVAGRSPDSHKMGHGGTRTPDRVDSTALPADLAAVGAGQYRGRIRETLGDEEAFAHRMSPRSLQTVS